MALTKRQIQSYGADKKADERKKEKLQKLLEGHLKDPSLLSAADTEPVRISAGGITTENDLKEDLMQAADATRNAQSGNAASAAIQGMSGYIGRNVEPKKEKDTATENIVFPVIPLSTASRANMVNAGLADRVVKPEVKATVPIMDAPVSPSLDAMNTVNKTTAGETLRNAQKMQETAVLPGVTRPYTQVEQMQERRRDGLREEKVNLQKRISGLELVKENIQEQVAELGDEQSDSLEKNNREVDSVEQRGAKIVDKRKKLEDTIAQIDRATNRIREIDEILNTPRETDIHPLAYQVARVGVGAVETAENWASSLAYTLGDALTDGNFSNNQKKVSDYLAQNPALAEQLYTYTPSAAQRIANDAGVSVGDVEMFRKTTGAEYLREGLNSADNITAGMQAAGNIAETIGQMLPSILLTAGYTPANPAKPADGVAKFIASKITPAPGDAFIGASVYGGQLEALGRERGFDVSNYLNAAANAAVETAIEKSLGFSDFNSFQKLFTPTGSTGKSLVKGLANYIVTGSEEGLEEVVNVPLSEIIDRMTGASGRTNIIGEGGIFDVVEMAKSGLSGSAVGLIMGGVGGMAAVAGSVVESGNIRRGIAELSGLQKYLPEAYRVEIPDAKKVTLDEFYALSAKHLENLERYKDDLAAGKVTMPEETPVQENTPITEADTPTADDNTPTETADVQTAKTEQNAPVSEDVAKTSEGVVKTEETAAISDEENNVEEDIETFDETFDETVDEDSPVAKSLRIAETDVYTAGNELVNAYGGVVEKAVDALYAEGNRLVKDGSAEARAKLNIVEAVRNDILSNNTKRVERNASHLNKILTEYGIQNVTVDMELADGEERGYYDPATKTIHLSPKLSSSEAVIFVIAHELGHHAAAADSTIVNDIMNIMPKMVEKGIFSAERFSYNSYLAAYAQIAFKHAASASGQAELKAHMDSGMTKEQAVQRIVDDYIHQEMASDILGELAKNPDILKRLKREDRTLWQRIVDAVQDFLAKVSGKAETREQQKMLDTIRSILEDVSGEELPSRSISNDTGVVYNANGEPVADETADGTIRLSLSTYDESGRNVFAGFLDKAVKNGRITSEEAKDMQNSIEEIYNVCMEFKDKYAPFSSWSDAKVVYDDAGKPVFSVETPNGEYKMNLDFSLVCKKRRALDAVFNEMAKQGVIDEFELGEKSVVKINEIIRSHGFETACALCFVDAKRFRQANVADTFVTLYNDLVKSLVPADRQGDISYFNFSGNIRVDNSVPGLDTLPDTELDFSHIRDVMKEYGEGTVNYRAAKYILENPVGRKLLQRGDFMSSKGFDAVKTQNRDILTLYNSKKGTGGPKAAFGDVQYQNEIIRKARTWTPGRAYAVGGVRVQSFSDYMARMVFDYVQMVYDMAATKLPAHSYTKEILYAKQFGLTGMKINLSLIPAIVDGGVAPGLDANGNYAWAGESINFDEAVELQSKPGYTENCGTIAVGVSEEHIRKMLNDPRIRMVIPYHKSSLNPIVAKMNKIAAYKDYTFNQNTRYSSGENAGKNLEKKDNTFNFNVTLRKLGDPKAAADAYLEWCDKNGYTPKFDEFRMEENYYKLLEDFTLYDEGGNYVPQRAVEAVFPKEGDAFGSMKELIQSGLEEDAVVQGARDEAVADIVAEIQKTLPKTEAEISEEEVEQATGDVEAGLVGEGVRYSKELDDDYMAAVESDDMDTAQRMVDEAAKAAGYTVKAYHGTPTGGFTEFDTSRIGSNTGVGRGRFSFTSDKSVADSYAGKDNKNARASELVTALNGLFRKYDSEELRMFFVDDDSEPVVWDSDIVIADGALDGGYIDFDFNWEDNDPGRYASPKEARTAKASAEFEGTRKYLIDVLNDYRKGADSSFDEFFNEALAMLESKSPDRTPKTYSVYLKTPSASFEADTNTYNSVSWEAAYSGEDVVVIHLDNGENRYFVNEPSSIKSADPVTYDDNGNVIPLSERFKDNNTDIRFSKEVFTEEEKLKFKLQEQKNFIKRQYTAETAFGSAVAASPAQRKAFSTEVAHGLPGVTIEMVERAIAPVWDIFEKAKGGSDDTVQSRVEQAYTKAQEAAEDLISRVTAKRINPQYEQYYELRKRLRTTPIRNDVSVQEFGGAEDYTEWRKKYKGLLRISDSADAVGIDTLYSELCEAYPEFFSKDVENPADKLKRLGEVAVKLKKTASAEKVDFDPLEGYKHEAASELADRIMIGFQQHSSMTMNAKNRLESEKAEKRLKDVEQESQKAFRMQQEEHKRQTASIVRDFNSSINKLMREVDRQNQKIDRLTTTLTGRNSNLMMAAEKKRFLSNLNKLYTMLTEPNKKKHIPETMKKDVAELLKQFEGVVLTDTKFVDAKLLDSIVKSVPDMQIVNGDVRVDDPFIKSLEIDLEVLAGIRESIASGQTDPGVQQETLVRMNTDYMRAANDILKKLNGYVMMQNQLFIDGKIQEADEFSAGLISDLTGRKRYKEGAEKNTFGGAVKHAFSFVFDKTNYESMNAGLFFEMIGESGVQLDHTFRAGQDKQAAHEEEFAAYMKRITGGKYNTLKAGGYGGERIQISVDNHDIDVSKAQLMSLYLLWKRPAARRHLEAQGAVFTDANGKEFVERTFVITQEIMNDLMTHLSDEDIRVADAMQKFLSHQCSVWGNEAAMQMYGYKMYEDPDYFPIRVSETVKMRNAPAWGAQLGDISLENSGFTKRVDRNSTSAVVVGNVFDITENHVKRMASYSAYAPICNDLQRVLSRGEVRGAILRGLGERGLKYIDAFLKNVNDNKVIQRETSGMYGWMNFLGNMSKRAAVSFNISTAAKQPLSIIRAFNEMDPKYILSAAATKGVDAIVYKSAEYKRLYDTMVENSGVAKMKMLGYSDAGFAKTLRQQWDDSYVNTDGALRSVMTAGKVTRALTKGYDWLSDFGMKGAAWTDEKTWVTIWKACELETADKYSNLSETERLSKTTERFGEIIGRTQVVDSVLDTAPFKENLLGSGLGAFMNEPIKQYANLVVAIDGLRNGKKGARNKLAVVLATTLANNLLLEPIVSAIFSGLRDEEDDSEQAFRKLMKNYIGVDLTDGSEGVKATDIAASQFADGLMGIVPAVGEIYGLVVDALQKYDNTRFETDGLQQVVKSVAALFTGGETKTTAKKVSELVSAIGIITGIPYKTLSRDIRAVIRDVQYATDNHLAAWNMNKLYYNIDSSSARSGKNFYDIMAHAYKEGDTEAYQQMRKELAEIPTSSSFGVSQKTITDNIEKRGGEVTVGSQLWYVDLQSSFHLEYFNKGMVPERMITEVYRKTKDNSVLPSPPSNTFTVNGESVKIEDPIQQEQFAAEVGDFSYMILVNMASSDGYKNLTDAQKQYAIEKAYDYARRRSRKRLYSAYDMGENLFKELYEKNAAPSSVASGILGKAKEKK